ncbi:MAG: M28 family peptidase [Candidatus Kapabacteria bacterium]|nr:M28 family peptidase [Ignavibacteriota bacterium]MCW5883976.1 M28 family peptidase [Candidatus Kapabacteria bacterium]
MKIYRNYIYIAIIIVLLPLLTTESFAQINPEQSRMREAVKYLSDDELKGRFPGTEGIEKAAVYIENHFRSAGLKNWNNTFRQEFSVATGFSYGQASSVALQTVVQRPGVPVARLPKVKQNWVLSEDFVPLGFSENGQVQGEIAFVGFGISATELDYDDYAGIDVKDKIVILISETPDKEKKDGPFANYSSLRYKATNAKNKGAIGIIMVRIQGDSMNVFERPEYTNMGKNSGIIAIQAWRQSLSKFFPKNQALIASENKIVADRKPQSFILPNVTVEINVEIIDQKSPAYNLNGFITGTDPKLKDEYILIGAHYDHLGYGGPTSMQQGRRPQIHNGADDNASGVAAMIELAYYYAQNPPKRSIIFSSFSGEEMGLLGSSYFVNNPPVDLSKIITMINIDMVGRMNKNEFTAFGTASGNIFPQMIDSLDLIDTLSITKASDAYGPSDHASFVIKDIPVLMFFTGVHEDYHKPSDTFQKINFNGMSWAVNFISRVVETLGNSDSRPEFIKSEMKAPERKSDREKGYGEVWFGIIPNFEESPLGCKISGATPGSPAYKAGLQPNDIIVQIDETEIKNLYDFMYKIREKKAGDVVNVHILRGDNYQEKIEVKVTLVQKAQ